MNKSLKDYVPDDLKTYVEDGIKVKNFDPHYKKELFLLWYRSGKPSINQLYALAPPDAFGDRPARSTMQQWIKHEWREEGEQLDAEVSAEIEKRIVHEKVEMLYRHAEIGKEMQDTARKWIEENYDQLTAASAVRLLAEGLRVERESRGIPAALESMIDKTDDDLLEDLENLLKKTPVDFEMLEE